MTELMAGLMIGGALFLAVYFVAGRRRRRRIEELTIYLENVNVSGEGTILQRKEDEFSLLEDEIYKTVTTLYRTRETALAAKENYAENLANIAHQLKTPITAASVSLQLLQEQAEDPAGQHDTYYHDAAKRRTTQHDATQNTAVQYNVVQHNAMPHSATQHTAVQHCENIRRQLERLNTLEEALLQLSRIDSGTLKLHYAQVDIFTALTIASDMLCGLAAEKKVTVAIPEGECAMIRGDKDWTMEAFCNLMKNCVEHTPEGGTVFCEYSQNPLYTEVRIWDNGNGFAEEDLPYLFQRFYRGKNASGTGIGIGLALSKAIVELQNGTITARNLHGGGACFEIRFYSH